MTKPNPYESPKPESPGPTAPDVASGTATRVGNPSAPEPIRHVSWGVFLVFLFVLLILSDIVSMLLGMLSSNLPPKSDHRATPTTDAR